MTKKKWIWVVVGLLAAALLSCGGLIGTVTYLAMRHLRVEKGSVESAEQEFDRARSRFAGRAPLIEVDEDDWEHPRINRPPASPVQAVLE